MGPERRRPQILDAALQIAAESGTAAVTIGAVAKHLGVTGPAENDDGDDPGRR